MTRKQELLAELNEIKQKEIESQLLKEEDQHDKACAINELKDGEIARELKLKEQKAKDTEAFRGWMAHSIAWGGDFIIKTLVAFAISAAFMHIVYNGALVEMSRSESTTSSGYFQLLSVVGPLFGLVLSYYFGKSKSSINGE